MTNPMPAIQAATHMANSPYYTPRGVAEGIFFFLHNNCWIFQAKKWREASQENLTNMCVDDEW